ncbi:MAG: hypothetical protein AB8B87_15185 [Granulosicoccus sp.]
MYLVSDNVKPVQKSKRTVNEEANTPTSTPSPVLEEICMESVLSLMSNIVETACEHGPDLSLVRLVNFMDLYRAYLQLANDPEEDLQAYIASISGPSDSVVTQKLGKTEFVSFERFVRDSRLLNIAASAATRASGETVAAPTPLTVSANG